LRGRLGWGGGRKLDAEQRVTPLTPQFLDLTNYTADLFALLPAARGREAPWSITGDLAAIIRASFGQLGSGYEIADEIAIHSTAIVEAPSVIKPPCIIGPGGFVGAFAYLRGGVFLAEGAGIGPSVEVKSSILLKNTKIAHLSFVGDSILGADVNVEAGAVIANRRNERNGKEIRAAIGGAKRGTGVEKFGALVGDRSRIGANAVLAPGTILEPDSIVARSALIDQDEDRLPR
jgi:bifunctional N-acetylglucosamine-1-phosphate-uridyltransferase/glucosamine-1-phosphate-acetyltransferase GlmU-like protein